jgi:hypothetical protein
MDKLAMRDAMVRQAFQLAYFIQGDVEIAARIVTSAMSKLSAAATAQDKRLYYLPGRRLWLQGLKSTKSRTKVFLSEMHLLQRLVYIESEPYEQQKERHPNSGSTTGIDEKSLIKHFIKHLVSISMMRNSFHVTLAVSRLLYNYTTAESMKLYDLIIQNPERSKDDAYWRERKARLMKELKARFGSLLAVTRGAHGEERFQAREDSSQYLELVRQCLQMFIPWDTSCPLPGTGPVSGAIEALAFQGTDPDEEHQIEISRIHGVLHADCFERLVTGLGFEPPERRLEIPRFFHSADSNGENNPYGTPSQPADISESELAKIRSELDKESGRHKRSLVTRLRILVDGHEHANLEIDRTNEVNFEIEEGARLIEVRTAREDGDWLLAVHLLSYDDLLPTAEPSHFTTTREGGQRISFTISPLHVLQERGGASVWGVSVVVTYQENHLLRARRRLGLHSSGGWQLQQWVKGRTKRYALAATIIVISTLGVAGLLKFRMQTSRQTQPAGQRGPASSGPTVSPSPLRGQSQDARPSTAAPSPIPRSHQLTAPRADTGPSVKATPGRLRGEPLRAAASLLEVKKICIEVSGDFPLDQSILDDLGHRLRASRRWAFTTHDEADALLKVAGSIAGRELYVCLINQEGQVIWPRAGKDRAPLYRVAAENGAAKIVAALLADLRELERQKRGD